MAKDSKFLAIDLGAESGRALMGIIEDNKIRLEELCRFPNGPVTVLGHMRWDILRLFAEIKQGLKLALQQTGGAIDGVGVDTWGVDFGLIDEDGELITNPYHYRDSRTDGMMDEVFKIVPREEILDATGNQSMQLNTLYQLFSMVKTGSAGLKRAVTLLFTPDLLNYWLTGVKTCEFSIATTSQCYDPRKRDWAREMLSKLGIPTHIFLDTIMPGSTIGPLAENLVAEMGYGKGLPIIAPATHDTGSAVAAVPASGDNWAYLSSGTWSPMGAEIAKPLVTDKALAKDFTNEGGVGGTARLLHNIMGLWLVQECRRTWLGAGEEISYAEMTMMAGESEGFVSVVDPNASVFLTPGDMPSRIQDYCRKTGQRVPATKGEIVRCALDSLALAYRKTMEDLDELLGRRLDTIHIVGGGTRNQLLSQLAADATGRKVVTGPVEATAIGNVLIQAIGAGYVRDLGELRDIVRNSFELTTFTPRESPALDKAYRLYRELNVES